MKSVLPIDQLVAEMGDAIAAIAALEKDIPSGIVPRFNQVKTIGCLNAEFTVHDDIPEQLTQGIFANPVSYPARLRFANATQQDDSKKDMRGLSIQLSNVDGEVLWGERGLQDFVLNSHPVLFVATPEDFLSFIKARLNNKKLWFFINPFDLHLKSLWIAFKARKKHLSPLDIRYWSTVPFRLGENTEQIVKYSIIPCSDYQTTTVVNAGKHQLRAAIKSHLQQADARFNFAVQLQTDSQKMPIEDASTVWDESLSPFQTLATITIKNQSFDDSEALAQCESCRFNPWQSLAAHEPLGRMNAVRKMVYANAAKLRQSEN